MRDLWDAKHGCIIKSIAIPKKLKASGVKRLVEDALWTQGLRTKLPEGKRRHEFQANHGFRKWFKTICETAGVKSIVTETLMGHSLGVTDSYYRPSERELIDEYLKAVDFLTISDESRLGREVLELKQKLTDGDYLRSRLNEKEQALKESVDHHLMDVDSLGNVVEEFWKLKKEVEELKKHRSTADIDNHEY